MRNQRRLQSEVGIFERVSIPLEPLGGDGIRFHARDDADPPATGGYQAANRGDVYKRQSLNC